LADEAATEELNIGLLLYIPYRAMETRVVKDLAAAGYDDFTPAQAQVFQQIGCAAPLSPDPRGRASRSETASTPPRGTGTRSATARGLTPRFLRKPLFRPRAYIGDLQIAVR
jgi:hypothetical protein